jgi:hypothetical protein
MQKRLTPGPVVGSRLKVYVCHGQPWQLWNYADGWLELTHYGASSVE